MNFIKIIGDSISCWQFLRRSIMIITNFCEKQHTPLHAWMISGVRWLARLLYFSHESLYYNIFTQFLVKLGQQKVRAHYETIERLALRFSSNKLCYKIIQL